MGRRAPPGLRRLFPRPPGEARGRQLRASRAAGGRLHFLRRLLLKIRTDLAVVGSGFGGSLTALAARRIGLSVALVERGTHPRFAIGESSSPLANLILEEIARRYRLERILPLCKWGTWQRAHPEIGCGRKRGFSFYRHETGAPFRGDPGRSDQLLVGASPNDDVADTHWYRPDFDRFLVEEARAAGAEYLDRTRLDRAEIAEDGAWLTGEREGEAVELRARLVVDASGPRGFLSRALEIPETRFGEMPETSALYAHFSGVRRLEEIGALRRTPGPPYPPDDAALHHVFDEGWIWVLRFGNGVTSAGVAARTPLADALGFGDGAAGWDRLLARLPTVLAQFEDARPVTPFVSTPRLSFRAARASGPGWTMLPSAAAFVDPLLSTGFPLTLLGVQRLASALEADWGDPRLDRRLEEIARWTLLEADTAARLVGALYSAFGDFPLFAALTKLYFAAASFSEAAHRLERRELATAFLCADRDDFASRLRRLCRGAIEGRADGSVSREALLNGIAEAIEPLDVAGLGHADRANWYPFRGEDLVENAGKVGATAEEARRVLERCGMTSEMARIDG